MALDRKTSGTGTKTSTGPGGAKLVDVKYENVPTPIPDPPEYLPYNTPPKGAFS